MNKHKLLLKYQNLFDSMPIPYIQCRIIEDNGFIDVMVLDANQAFNDKIISKDIIWHKNREELENTDIGSIEKYMEVAQKVLKTKEVYLTEFNINNCIYDVIITTSDEENVINTFLVDITEQIQLEQNLRDALNKAEEANKLKSSFLANISHEIRTPLNAIVGFSTLLPSAESEEEANGYLGIIKSNNGLLLQLIDDILDMAKIEAGALDFSKTTFSVNDLLDEVIHSTRLGLDNAKVEILCYKQEVDFLIHSCRNRIMQVLINLINNSMKFTKEGSISIGYNYLPDENRLLFFVRDTGIGIPEDKQKEIFERFVKLDPFVQGSGLGLSICKMIIHTIGGDIWVESEIGKWTCFWFTIPYS